MFNMIRLMAALMLSMSTAAYLVGCGSEESSNPSQTASNSDHDHDHDEGEDQDHDHEGEDYDHDHGDEVSLGTAMIGDIQIEAAQGHGEAAAGKELHIVVKLPYTDNGASEVRVWIGTEDRFASVVEKAEYASSHDDYDAHAVCPDPLPEDAAWWIEITQPDGSVHTGSIGLK